MLVRDCQQVYMARKLHKTYLDERLDGRRTSPPLCNTVVMVASAAAVAPE
jgi:hypothetical protein